MKKENNGQFSVLDEVTFWHKYKYMEGVILEVRKDSYLVQANPIDMKTNKRLYVIEHLGLKRKNVIVLEPVQEMTKRPGHRKCIVNCVIVIGEVKRNFKITIVSELLTLNEIEREFKNYPIELPYTNTAGVETVWKTTFGRVKELALLWESNIISKKNELPNGKSEILFVYKY